MALELARTTAASGITKATGKIAAAAGASPAASFADSLSKLVDSVEQTQSDANTAVVDMVDGSTEVHDAMIALQRAEMSLELTVQIRNKLVQAYQDIQRMPI